jgi:hypothetical protein
MGKKKRAQEATSSEEDEEEVEEEIGMDAAGLTQLLEAAEQRAADERGALRREMQDMMAKQMQQLQLLLKPQLAAPPSSASAPAPLSAASSLSAAEREAKRKELIEQAEELARQQEAESSVS